jgi:hypothetical protein
MHISKVYKGTYHILEKASRTLCQIRCLTYNMRTSLDHVYQTTEVTNLVHL